jgi:hypothetical protein
MDNAVGMDLTAFHTIRSDNKKDIVADYLHYDHNGAARNDGFGNWMVDYIETITLVNQGNKERTFTYTLTPAAGAIATFIRNENGYILDDYSPRYSIAHGWDLKINHPFKYSVKDPAHTVKQFSVNYNLLANSTGTITHSAELK